MARGHGFALAISLVAHLALAGVVARHARPIASIDSALAAAEHSAPEIEVSAPPEPELAARPPATESVHLVTHPAAARVASLVPVARSIEPAEPTRDAPELSALPQNAGPRFVMTVVRAPALTGGATSAEGLGAGNSLPTAAPLSESAVDSPARLRAGSAPAYTAEALAAGIETDVALEIVLNDAGLVVSARSVQHVGYGLDEAALNSVRSYRFSPALRAGKAVPVRMRWLMRFQLR